MQNTAGIHHISAMVNDAQRNIDFYVGVLGLRLVKKTINFDRPEVYHLYSADEPVTGLGKKLMLPSWLESEREKLEETLPHVEVRVLEGDK